MNFFGFSDIGNKRELNEDFYAAFETGGMGVLVVADGMGGHNAGEVASSYAVEAIKDSLCENSDADVAKRLKAAVFSANDIVYKKSKSDDCYSKMGTTAVVCCIKGSTAFFANVGDSRGYIITEDGITQVTEDDSLVSELVRKGKITPEEAKHHPQRNVITKAIGTDESVEPRLSRVPCKAGAVVLLCTDGLTEYVNDDEILEVFKEFNTKDAIKKLIELALSRGGFDNITAVACVIDEVEDL